MMDNLTIYPYSTLLFYGRDMIITLDSYSAYLVLPKSRSWSATWYIFGQDLATVTNPMTNAPFRVMWNNTKNVMASAAES